MTYRIVETAGSGSSVWSPPGNPGCRPPYPFPFPFPFPVPPIVKY